MVAMDLSTCFLTVNPKFLSKEEKQLLESELLANICSHLKEICKTEYFTYLRLIKSDSEMEDTMVEVNFIEWVIKDILLTGEYSLSGIAYYTHTPEDVVHEIIVSTNLCPSALFSSKIN